MKFQCLVIVLCYLLLVIAKEKATEKDNNKKKQEVDNGTNRLKILTAKLENATSIILSDKNFSTYIIERPRLYTAVLLFTATDPQYQCSICNTMHGVFKDAAAQYQIQVDLNASSIENRVIFFEIDVDNGRKVFGDMGIESVPRVFVLPHRDRDAERQRMTDFEVDMKAVLEGGLKSILAEINRFAGTKVLTIF